MSAHGAEAASATAGGNYFTIDTNGTQNSPVFHIKACEIYFSASSAQLVDVMAGLTGIGTARINNLTSGSHTNWSGSTGIG